MATRAVPVHMALSSALFQVRLWNCAIIDTSSTFSFWSFTVGILFVRPTYTHALSINIQFVCLATLFVQYIFELLTSIQQQKTYPTKWAVNTIRTSSKFMVTSECKTPSFGKREFFFVYDRNGNIWDVQRWKRIYTWCLRIGCKLRTCTKSNKLRIFQLNTLKSLSPSALSWV